MHAVPCDVWSNSHPVGRASKAASCLWTGGVPPTEEPPRSWGTLNPPWGTPQDWYWTASLCWTWETRHRGSVLYKG